MDQAADQWGGDPVLVVSAGLCTEKTDRSVS